MNIEMTIDENR